MPHPWKDSAITTIKSIRSSRRLALATLSLILTAVPTMWPSSAQAQSFDGKPITMVLGYPPGGSNDIAARIIAPHLGEALKTTVIIDYKPGANGTIGATSVVRAKPDGHTVFLVSSSPVVIVPQTMQSPPFDVRKDLQGINMIGYTPEAIAVGSKLKDVKNLAELIALSRKQQVTLASSGIGGLPHLTIELLTAASQGKILHVPYKGGGPAATDTVAGHTDGIVMDLPPLFGMIKDGRLRALAVTSANRVSFLPDVPTAQEVLPGFDVVNWVGVFAPAQTPKPMVDKISEALIKVMARPDVIAQMEKAGLITQTMQGPAQFQQFVSNEYTRWGDVLKKANVSLTN